MTVRLLFLLLVTCFLAGLPLLLGIWVNTHAPYPPTRTHAATHCTRYCARHHCTHATRANSPAYFRLRPLYRATVAALGAGGRGRYAYANVAFYLLFMPALLGWLTYGALRDAGRIRQLKQMAAGMSTSAHVLARLVHGAFWYCCDFMVSLANLTHTSYYEANTWVLLLLLPGLLALLIGVRATQWFRLRRR